MKKISLGFLTLTAFFAVSVSANAFTISITDPSDDAIGVEFETTGMTISNIYTKPIEIIISTIYPQSGVLVGGEGGWQTMPADIFVTETLTDGNDYLWAIPLIDHDSFKAGGLYAVGSVLTSNYFEPDNGNYVYNEDAPVRIGTLGNNYGFESFVYSPSVTWEDGRVVVNLGGTYFDPNVSSGGAPGTEALSFYWGTATCGNDEIGNNPVPEPGTLLLMGFGLAGLVGYNRRRKK